MNMNILKWPAIVLTPAAMLAVTSCSSTSSTPPPPPQTSSAVSYQPGVPGGVVVQTHKMTATVTGIDAPNRKVTLLGPGGEKTTVKCGPEVINFDQIQVGDHLKVTVAEELAVAMGTPDAPPSDGGATLVALAPQGAKPGGVMANTMQVTAKVTAIDLQHHRATLQLPDGTTHAVAVRPDVDLTQRKVGEEVVIRCTEALALSVEKP